jgi:hypothetical protein
MSSPCQLGKSFNTFTKSAEEPISVTYMRSLVLRFTNSVLVLGLDLLLKWEAC